MECIQNRNEKSATLSRIPMDDPSVDSATDYEQSNFEILRECKTQRRFLIITQKHSQQYV